MSVGPFDIGKVVTRMQGGSLAYRKIAISADLAAAIASDAPVPSAFVVLASERPGGDVSGSGVLGQHVVPQIQVATKARNYRASELGGQLVDDLNSLLAAQRELLLNWKPEGADLVLRFAGGRLHSYDAATAWWIDSYETRYLIRKN